MTLKEQLEAQWRKPGVEHPAHLTIWVILRNGWLSNKRGKCVTGPTNRKLAARIRRECPRHAEKIIKGYKTGLPW